MREISHYVDTELKIFCLTLTIQALCQLSQKATGIPLPGHYTLIKANNILVKEYQNLELN